MKLAVTYDNGQVFQHFGKTAQFKIYDITPEGKVGFSMVTSTGGQGHGALGPGAQAALAELGITVIPGVVGDADQAVQDFVDGKLVSNTEALCSHHPSGDVGFGCGHHTCGGGCQS